MADSIADAWGSYARDVVPPDAPPVQLRECRRAFMAGAWAVLQLVKGLGVDEPGQDVGAAFLEALEGELRRFQRDVRAGVK